jgi:scyllo-inositol 2-dehydrogenase (NADP+)
VDQVGQNGWKEAGGPGSGILYNLGSHMIDQVLVLFGKPLIITAEIDANRPGSQIDDYYDLKFIYPGFKVILKASYLVREPGPRYALHGTKGSFVKYGIDPQEEALKAGQKPDRLGWGQEPASDWGKLNTEEGGLHVLGQIETIAGNYNHFYNNVYDVIREGKELYVKPEEAAMVIYLIELAYQSSTEGRSVEVGE